MSHHDHHPGLSPEAFIELKKICIAEYGDTTSDEEILEIGKNLLNLFKILLPSEPQDKAPTVTKLEFALLKFLHQAIYHEHRLPSVREIAQVLGFRSSRSGMRALDRLMKRGLVYRNAEGTLHLLDGIRECKPMLNVVS